MSSKKPLLIACESLKEEIEELLRNRSLDVDAVFLSIRLHMNFENLRRRLEEELSEQVKKGRKIVVVYGDYCHPQMKEIVKSYGAVKVDAINCLDCLLGGKGKIFEIDPTRSFFYLSPGWLKSFQLTYGARRRLREMFHNIKGKVLIEYMGELTPEKVTEFTEATGLTVVRHERVGLEGLKRVIEEALSRL